MITFTPTGGTEQASEMTFQIAPNNEQPEDQNLIGIEPLKSILIERMRANPNEFRAPYQIELEGAYAKAIEMVMPIIKALSLSGKLYLVGSTAQSGKYVGTDIDLQFLGDMEKVKEVLFGLMGDPVVAGNSTNYMTSTVIGYVYKEEKRWYLLASVQPNNSVRFYIKDRNSWRGRSEIKKDGNMRHLIEMKVNTGPNPKTVLEIDLSQKRIYRILPNGLIQINADENRELEPVEDGIDKSGATALRLLLKTLKGNPNTKAPILQTIDTVSFDFMDIFPCYKTGMPSVDYFLENTLLGLVKEIVNFKQRQKLLETANEICLPRTDVFQRIYPLLKFLPEIASLGGLEGFLDYITTMPLAEPDLWREDFSSGKRYKQKSTVRENLDEDRKEVIQTLISNPNISARQLINFLFNENTQRASIKHYISEYKTFAYELCFDLNFSAFLGTMNITSEEFVDLLKRILTISIISRYQPGGNELHSSIHLHDEYARWQREIVRKRYKIDNTKSTSP